MKEKENKRKRRREPLEFQDFRVILTFPERLAVYLRQLLHLDKPSWDFAVDKIRQGKAYLEWSKSKGRGKGRRHFAAPCPELMAVQQAILHRLLESIPVHFSRYGGQRGSRLLDNAAAHAGARHVFSIDLVNAFPSVFRSRVRANLRKPLRFRLQQFKGVEFSDEDHTQMLECLLDLTTLHDRLPQGTPTSPRILDIVCRNMDQELYALCEGSSTALQRYRLTAYADDLTISSGAPIPDEFRRQALETVTRNGFIPHTRRDKTEYFAPELGTVPVVTGLVLSPDGRVTMHPRKVNQIRGRLGQLLRKEQWDPAVIGEAAGLLGYVSQIYPARLPSRLRQPVAAVRERSLKARADLATARAAGTEIRFSNSLYTDGVSRGNPGPAAIGGVLIVNGEEVVTISRTIGKATNNYAEYSALIAGLEAAIEEGVTELDCYLDSELVVNQLTGKAAIKNPDLRSLYLRATELAGTIGTVRFHHIPREQNARADALANQAFQQAAEKRRRKKEEKRPAETVAQAAS